MKKVDTWAGGELAGKVVAEQIGMTYKRTPLWLNLPTALLWIELLRRAEIDGVMLVATRGWVSYREQEELWKARQDPYVKATRGGASRPGYSKHHLGDAIDILTGNSIQDIKEGRKNQKLIWLEEHAPKVGLVQTIPGEHWHFERVVTPELRGDHAV